MQYHCSAFLVSPLLLHHLHLFGMSEVTQILHFFCWRPDDLARIQMQFGGKRSADDAGQLAISELDDRAMKTPRIEVSSGSAAAPSPRCCRVLTHAVSLV